MTPNCSREEWMNRATAALAKFKPDYTPEELASAINGELWDEACDMAPEDAAEIYATEHPE